ncbi:hypothetical protein ACOMHN_061149 [Nucella lapillus]
MQPSDCYPTLPLGSKMMCINISWNLASCTTARLPPSAAAVRGDCTDCGMVAPRSMALHSITASQCAFTQPPPADGPAFPPATSRPAVGSGQRPPLIQASCPTSYH